MNLLENIKEGLRSVKANMLRSVLTALIVAIRTARWAAVTHETTSHRELDVEVDFAAYVASRVLSAVLSKHESLFPKKRVPWYHPMDEDIPK